MIDHLEIEESFAKEKFYQDSFRSVSKNKNFSSIQISHKKFNDVVLIKF